MRDPNINDTGITTTGVWLRNDGPWLEVLVEVDGEWRVAIREYAPLDAQSISHIVEPLGIMASPTYPAKGIH